MGRFLPTLFLLLLIAVIVTSTSPFASRGRAPRDTNSISDPAPSSGRQRILVLTVEYPNQRGKYDGAQWKNGLFKQWVDYFNAQSYNKLQYTVDVVTIDARGNPVINQASTTSYIPLSNAVSVYANGLYGWKFGTEWNLHTIVHDACVYLDSKRFDWSPYIQNGRVQNVLILSAGYDYRYAQSSGLPNATTNYLLSTSYSGVNYRTPNGAFLYSYTFCNEHTQNIGTTPVTMANLGQCAHEFGHALGMPDLYDLSWESSGVGYFDVLGYGVYANGNQDGSTPVGFGPYPKTALGWAEPVVIKKTTQVQLGPVSTSAANMLKVLIGDSPVYYLIENKQPVDTWDKNFVNQFTSGIVIWRVNGTAAQQYTLVNTVNSYASLTTPKCPATPAIVVMEADGRQDMSEPRTPMNYGRTADIWQVGKQFNISKDVSIGVMAVNNQVYTIKVSFDGPIDFPPDEIHGSAYSLIYSPVLFVCVLAVISLLF